LNTCSDGDEMKGFSLVHISLISLFAVRASGMVSDMH